MHRVYLGLGSNLGDRRQNIEKAVALIGERVGEVVCRSSLMETAAFGGYELVMEAYDMAVKNGYKFGCFGDALLILND